MKLFTEHPSTVKETWWQHCKFSMGVSCRLFASSIFFIIHGLFPFITIPKQINLEYTAGWLEIQSVRRKIQEEKED